MLVGTGQSAVSGKGSSAFLQSELSRSQQESRKLSQHHCQGQQISVCPIQEPGPGCGISSLVWMRSEEFLDSVAPLKRRSCALYRNVSEGLPAPSSPFSQAADVTRIALGCSTPFQVLVPGSCRAVFRAAQPSSAPSCCVSPWCCQ